VSRHPPGKSYRWFVVGTFFVFILLHQADKLLIGPLTTPIMETFGIDEARMGFVFSGAIIVGAICYPLWGFLYDRFVRARLLALASLIWGATTWLSAIARTFPGFVATRASTGIDDSSYPGLYNVAADYFEPRLRGRVNGLMQLAMPLGYLAGMVLALMLGKSLGWRNVFLITGGLGVLLAVVIFLGVREPQRGATEPELAGVEQKTQYRFTWKEAVGLFRKKSLVFLFANGFFGVFPWQVITYWFFRYLEKERGYDSTQVLLTMVVAVLVLAAGYPIAGTIGDALFRRTPRGRVIVAAVGVLLGAILLVATLSVPAGSTLVFAVLLTLTALFIPFASPNVLATIYDVTPPEVRSSANAVAYFFESLGSAAAPALAGIIAVRSTLGTAIMSICTVAWLVCFVMLLFVTAYVPKDIAALRKQLADRARS
jgi:MFS transporter, Spinster family, sphingosine-1-phosphate transporter